MTKTKLGVALFALLCAFGIEAQVTTTPTKPTINDKNIVITFNAAQGTAGLKNLPATDAVYAHTGVITTKSKNDTDWKHAPTWGDNSEKYKLTKKSTDIYELVIPDINEYYGVTSDEIVTKLAFVFRNSDQSKEGKATGGKDILVELDGFFMTFTSNKTGNVITSNSTVTFTVGTTKPSDVTLTIDGVSKGTKSNVTSCTFSNVFTTKGNYVVTATAVPVDPQYPTRTETINFCYASASAQATYPGGVPKMGPVKNDDGTVTFCVAAPGKTNAMIVGSWNDYAMTNDQVMNYQDYNGYRYFWTTVSGLDDVTMYPYFFVFDYTTKIADPYARLALDQYDQYLNYGIPAELPEYPSEHFSTWPLSIYQGKLDGNNYDWKVKNFKGVDPENLVIYELLLRDFTGKEGEAGDNGNIKLAIEKFDHIKNLGVNAVELLPIMEFNGANSWGYNTNLYFAPDKAYGMPDDYKEFIDLCHQNGIAVILDIVFNQAQDHPWLTLYGSTSASPFFNATAPHSYSVLNDWNQDNPLVDQQWKDCLQYWLKEYNVDGFRFDLVKGLGDNNSYGSGTEAYNKSRVERMKKLHGYIKEIKPDAYHINENLAGPQEENEMATDGQLNWVSAVNNAGCQYAMGYSSGATLGNMYAPTYGRTWGSTIAYLESHDEERLAYKQDQYSPTSIKNNTQAKCQRLGSAAAQMILMPGAHMIWMFGEIGNAQTTKKSDGTNNTDPKTVNWSLKDDPDHKGLYDSYSELIVLRTNNPELFAKDASVTIDCSTNQSQANENTWPKNHTIYLVSADKKKELYAVMNPQLSGSTTVTLPLLNDGSMYEVASRSYNANVTYNASTKQLTVPANCYAVVASTVITAIDDIEGDVSDRFQAYGVEGGIVVKGASAPVDIYSADGRLVTRFVNDGRVDVVPGIYIVRSNRTSVKVLAK